MGEALVEVLMNRFAVIMAAGKGSRMKSKRDDISKVSYPILGVPLVKYVLMALKPIGLDKIISVVGHGGEVSKEIVSSDSEVVWQKEQKGSGHAVLMAAPILEGLEGETMVCCGDTPLLRSSTLREMFESHEKNDNSLTILTFEIDDPTGYGRIVKDSDGNIQRIVEQKDTTPETAKIKEVNAGVYIFDNRVLFESLKNLRTDNAAGEYYLTDVIEMFVSRGLKVASYKVPDAEETLGVNDRYQLAAAAKILQLRINKGLMLSGVSIDDPNNTYISPLAAIEADAVIHPNTTILGKCHIGEAAELGPNLYLEDCDVHSGARLISGWHIGKTL